MGAREYVLRFFGDTKELQRDLDTTAAKAEQTEGKFGKLKAGAAGFGAGLVAGISVDKIQGALSSALAAAEQAQVTAKKASTVFDSSLPDIQAWSKGAAASMGLTKSQLTGLAAGFGDLLKPMGFTAEQAADQAKEVLNLSGALSAWSGGQRSASDVADILQKAILGERDGLKGLGISISEADVQARLARDGKEKLTGAALEQAKALATEQLIMEKSTDAQKAWADGTFDAQKRSAELKAKQEELIESLGAKLLPLWQGVQAFLIEKLVPAIGTVTKWVGDHKEIVIAAGVGIAATLIPAFIAWASSAAAAAAATIAATAPVIAIGAAIAALAAGVIYAYQHWGWFREAIDKVADIATNVVWPILKTIGEWFGTTLVPAIQSGLSWFGNFASGLKDKVGEIAGVFKDIAGVIVLPYKVAFNAIATAWNNTAGRLSFKAPSWVPGIGGKGFDMPNLPTIALASGGIVRSPTMALIGEAGPEAVVPLNGRNGLGGITIGTLVVNASPGIDRARIGLEILDSIRDAIRSGAVIDDLLGAA